MPNTVRVTPGPGQDITERQSTIDYKSPAYAATINLVPTKKRTVVQPGVLTGALTLNIGVGSTTAPPFIGDELTVMFLADATGRTVTFGTGTAISAATLVLGVSKRGSITFVFDGVAWVETGRCTQA
jgi:hypothetical protein